jgi:hypothetical protein
VWTKELGSSGGRCNHANAQRVMLMRLSREMTEALTFDMQTSLNCLIMDYSKSPEPGETELNRLLLDLKGKMEGEC